MQHVVIFAEDHTRNAYYLDNLIVLQSILQATGKNVLITNNATCLNHQKAVLTSHSGKTVTFFPVENDHQSLINRDGHFVADFVLINNDLTNGVPEVLTNINAYATPPVNLGWHNRRKSSHFETYNNLVYDFCSHFSLDPWLLSTFFHRCGIVNFKEKKGIECVAERAEKVLQRIKIKYQEYGIKDTAYVFIKADRGTYGMGIMNVRSGDEIYEMGKNIRKRMSTIKGGVSNTEVIIQEGVPTIDTVEGKAAEPMLYMVGGDPVGCIYRINDKRNAYDNLNASGMSFSSMHQYHHDTEKFCQTIGLVAKLASYAASWECYVESYTI